jgi:CRP-like cAMP-binding protein
MSVTDMLEVVSKCSLFKGFNHSETYYVIRFFKKECFDKGDIVIQEGQTVKALYIVGSGKWEVFLPQLYRPTEIKLHILEPGALIGEYSCIDNQTASASVRAVQLGELYKITREDFTTLVDSSNRVGKLIYKNLLETLVTRLRKHNEETELRILLEG